MFTGLLYLIQQFRYWKVLRKNIHNKEYMVFWKSIPEHPVFSVKCKVKRNVIEFNGIRISDGYIFSGEIIVNPITLRTAEGYHIFDEKDGFAFLKVAMKADNKTFFVEGHYTRVANKPKNKNNAPDLGAIKKLIDSMQVVATFEHQAFVWKQLLK